MARTFKVGLQEFLFPQEEIKYQSPHSFHFAGQEYVVYITNRRVIGHKLKGFIFKKDRVFSVALQEITNLDYKEKGLVHKKGYLTIETATKKEGPFEGEPEDTKSLWREMQKYLGFREALGVGDANPTGFADPAHVLKMRLARGEITPEEYAQLRNAMDG